MVKALKALDMGELHSNEWMHAEGVVLYRGRVYIPDNPQLHHDLVHAHHGAMVTGHPGQWKTLELVLWSYWWPGLSRYVDKFVTGCNVCNQCRQDKNSVSSPPLEPCFDIPNNSLNHLLNSLFLWLEKLTKKSSNQTTYLFSCQTSLYFTSLPILEGKIWNLLDYCLHTITGQPLRIRKRIIYR